MTTLTRARSLSSSGCMRPFNHGSPRRGAQPVAALLSARRSYWASRATGVKPRGPGRAYEYMAGYPARHLPQYSKHADGLREAYTDGVARGRKQATRLCSNWGRRDPRRDEDKVETSSDQRTQSPGQNFKIRGRKHGEEYARWLEEREAWFRNHPYWGLFGQSELRGAWNPWRRADHLQKRFELLYQKYVENESQIGDEPVQKLSKSKTHAPTPDTGRTTPGEDQQYIYDPVTNKKVPQKVTRSTETQIRSTENRPTEFNKDISEPIDVPVKKYRPNSTTASLDKQLNVAVTTGTEKKTSALAGFARQPWLVEEGFAGQESAKDISTKRSAEEPGTSAGRHNPPAAESPRLNTSLYRSLQSNKHLRYDESPDRREDLDLLRPRDVRAASGKLVSIPEPENQITREKRWQAVESAASDIFSDRESRLAKELAVNNWDMKRNWSAYPGEIPSTAEELRAQRRLLERTLNSSIDLLEIELTKILKASPSDAQDSSIAEVADPEHERRTTKRKLADKALQAEVDQQKAAMTAHENQPRSSSLSSTAAPPSSKFSPGSPTRIAATVESPEQVQRKAKERALVKEICKIYEDTYGTIDSKHRQAPPPKSFTSKTIQSESLTPLETSLRQHEEKHGVDIVSPRVDDARLALRHYEEMNGIDVATSNSDSARRALRKHEEKHGVNVANSSDGSTKAKPIPKSELLKPEGSPSIDRAQLLEASVRDFERLMSNTEPSEQERKPKPSVGKMSAGDAFAAEITCPGSNYVSDQLTTELEEIAKQAPNLSSSKPMRAQPVEKVSVSSAAKESPTKIQAYVVMMYDKSVDKVRLLRSTSSTHVSNAPYRTIDSILGRLDKPARYFSHMERLEKAGYELVAGSKKLLVYRDTMNRSYQQLADLEPQSAVPLTAGWGTESKPIIQSTTAKAQPSSAKRMSKTTDDLEALSSNPTASSQSRPMRRLEDKFSGLPPLRQEQRPSTLTQAEKEQLDEQKQPGPVRRLLRISLVMGALFYGFGVTLEWLKDRERAKMIQEYQQEVERVKEHERKRSAEQVASGGFRLF